MAGKSSVKQRLRRCAGKGAPGYGVAAGSPGVKTKFLQQVAVFIGNSMPGTKACAERSRSMVFVDITDVFRAVWILNMQGKNTFRAAEVGEGFLLAVFGNVLTGASPNFGGGVVAFGVLLFNGQQLLTLPGFKKQTYATHCLKSKVIWR
jgi:hypothetical protein